jgi:predicted PurR-regulated permease PerM
MAMDRERIIQVFFFGLLALMGYSLYQLISPFLIPIVWAMLLAFLFFPAAAHVNRWLKNRTLAAAVITTGTALLVIVPSLYLVTRLALEAQTLYGSVSDLVSGGGLNRMRDWLMQSRYTGMANGVLAKQGVKLEDELPKLLVSGAKITSDYMAGHVAGMARNLATVISDFGITLLTLFYLLRDGDWYYEQVRNLTPLHEEDKHAVFETLRTTLSSVMRGLMLTSVSQGALIGLGFLIFSVPYWAFLAILTAASGLLPFGGTALVWLPAAAYLLYAYGWGPAIGLVVWSTIAGAIISNFIKPWAMRHGTGLPTLALFFGIAGGFYAYGPLGLFAGPAVISVFTALLRVYRKTYAGLREAA